MGLKPAVRVHRRIAEIGRDAWDACARRPGQPDNPFVAYDFLDILEESGCAVERQGWGPHGSWMWTNRRRATTRRWPR